jgi:hypothetical protein
MTTTIAPRLIDSRHPSYLSSFMDWDKWRTCYDGGDTFRNRYLQKFDTREDTTGFNSRKEVTPTATFAKSAINDIRNAIFPRLNDVIRTGGSEAYQKAINGEDGGIDRRGSTMGYFLGNRVLSELLVMGRVGIYVDMPPAVGPTLADAQGVHPYLYYYTVEDILNFAQTKPESPSEFQTVLLRDSIVEYDQWSGLPQQTTQRYRKVWINPATGFVNVQFYDLNEILIGGPIELALTRIPFVMLDIGDSLMKDVAQHQIALLNLASSDVNYALKSNFPFYTEQRDSRAVGSHLKRTASDGTATTGGQGADDDVLKVGVTQGRYYDLNTDRPGFIAPPSEPLEASMKLQDRLESQIRKLVNLAVVSLNPLQSATAKQVDREGLQNGLSFIGLVLQGGEQAIAAHYASYEDRIVSRQQVAVVKYPDSYSQKTDDDRINEATKLSELLNTVPGRAVKKELAKVIVTVLLSGKVRVDKLHQIYREVDEAEYTTSDPETIINAKDAGLVGEQIASIALGFSDNEYLQARKDHIDRIKRIAETQGVNAPGARGVGDLAPDAAKAGSEEKELSRETDEEDTTESRVRGETER